MKYKVLTPFKFLHVDYKIGDEIELTDTQAVKLGDDFVEPIIKPFSKRFDKTALHTNSQEQ